MKTKTERRFETGEIVKITETFRNTNGLHHKRPEYPLGVCIVVSQKGDTLRVMPATVDAATGMDDIPVDDRLIIAGDMVAAAYDRSEYVVHTALNYPLHVDDVDRVIGRFPPETLKDINDAKRHGLVAQANNPEMGGERQELEAWTSSLPVNVDAIREKEVQG